MKKIYINQDWTFNEIINEIKVLKAQYKRILASFSYFQLKYKVQFKKETRQLIYSLKFEEWKKDKIWDYINDFEFYSVLENVSNKSSKKGR